MLINKWKNELNLKGMNLNNEAIMLLSSQLHKYKNINKIDISGNNCIKALGLKSLISKYHISKITFDAKGKNDILIDRDIPQLVKHIQMMNKLYYFY